VGSFQLRAATVDDVEAYVRCHVECLAETYADLMPPEFAEQHRHAIPRRIDETRRSWAGSAADGHGPLAWLATDEDGLAVGVARSGPGPQQWEVDLGAPVTTVGFELHHIYTRRHTHGSGLGQSLLEAAVGDRDAYLWILHGNVRAERFYRRNAFAPDGAEMSCGPTWFHRSMFRMVRRGRPG
jgi:GNAT superfamily N-acetyltransferase